MQFLAIKQLDAAQEQNLNIGSANMFYKVWGGEGVVGLTGFDMK